MNEAILILVLMSSDDPYAGVIQEHRKYPTMKACEEARKRNEKDLKTGYSVSCVPASVVKDSAFEKLLK